MEPSRVEQSQDFGELGHQVPVAGLLVVIVALCVVGLLVLPKIMETHKTPAPEVRDIRFSSIHGVNRFLVSLLSLAFLRVVFYIFHMA